MAIKRIDPKATFKVICEYDSVLVNETEEEKVVGTPTRYESYIENLDESKLKLKEGDKPTYFVIRCLTNRESILNQEKYVEVDVVAKKSNVKNPTGMLLEMFNLACLGMEDENGKVVPVTSDDIGLGVAINIGSLINLYTSLGKNLKNA